MKRLLFTSVLGLCLLNCSLAIQAQETGSKQSENAEGFVLHVDVDRLRESQTGRTLFESVKKSPYVAGQLATIPDELAFIKSAQIHSITICAQQPHAGNMPVVDMVADVDSDQIVALIEHGREYAKVNYRQVDVHHWITDLRKLSHQLMGQKKPVDDEVPETNSIYLAMPSANRIIVSTSLAKLTAAIDRSKNGETLVDYSLLAKQFGESENLVSYYSKSKDKEFPGNMLGVIREEESGRVVANVAIECRNGRERALATTINSLLNQPELAAKSLAPKIQTKAGDVPERKIEIEATIENEDDSKHTNKLSVALAFDSKIPGQNSDSSAWFEELLSKSVESKYENELLTINAGFFVGVCEVTNMPRDTVEAKEKGQKLNSLVVKLNAYSTAAKRDAANRIAANSESVKGKSSDTDETLKR